MQNARLTERAAFLAEVDILALGHSTPRRVWGMDVSEEGMFLQTTHPFRIGDRVSLRFGVQVDGTEEHEVHIRAAEVRWVRPFEPVAVDGRMAGIGLQFVSIDPPARAALRRFSKPAEREEITLPERIASSHTSDVGLGMLPPPTASLPPVTGSIARHATTTPREITEEMLAVSLPPFSTPPRAPRPDQRTSLPPDELMDEVFACTALQQLRSKPPRVVPRGITMLPKSTPPRVRSKKPTTLTHPPMPAATDPPLSFDVDVDFGEHVESHGERRDHPLAGWRFELAVFADSKKNDTAPPTHLSEKARSDRGEQKQVTPTDPASAEAPAPKLKLSFDDERPSERSVLPSIIVEPSILMMESAPPQDAASSGPSPAFEEAFLRGEVALADLPTVTERAPSRGTPPQQKHKARPKPTTRSRALVTAAVLIAAGTTVGAGLGFAGKKLARASTPPAIAVAAPASVDTASPLVPPLVPPALAADTAPRGVADIERGVPARALPDPSTAQSTQPKPALAPLVPVTALAKAEKPEKPAAQKTTAQKPTERKDLKPAKPTKTEGFKLDIPVGDAKVTRTFLLASPSRVVVDLEGGTLPKQSLDGDGKKTERVRFGAPQPGMSRVVVELADGVTATDVAATVHDGRLALSFR